jgi:hypothetical protein
MIRFSLRTLFLLTTLVAALASRVGVEPHGRCTWLTFRYAPSHAIEAAIAAGRPITVYRREPYPGGTQYTVLYHSGKLVLPPAFYPAETQK